MTMKTATQAQVAAIISGYANFVSAIGGGDLQLPALQKNPPPPPPPLPLELERTTERELQCNVCCNEYEAVVTCINYQVGVLFSPSVGGCANCVDGLIKGSGNCADVLLETCDGFDTCLCNSSCKLFTDNYLKCMKGVSCASDTCSDSPGTTISGDNNGSTPDQ